MIARPKNLIHTKWENIEGHYYKQPIKYCNDKELTLDKIVDFENIFGENFSDVSKKSKAYKDSLGQSMFHSMLWKRRKAKNKAFLKILEYNLYKRCSSDGSVTPLFPFEIYLMNDGFEMESFSALNKLSPTGRIYKKNEKIISLGCGLGSVNFYFQINGIFFQVENDFMNYDNAVNGNLVKL